jgi:AraC family carnitine catabolism transcriptional activator
VAILLCPGFSHFALPAVTEPLFVANWLLGENTFVWQTYSVDGLAVATSSGASVPVNAPLGARDEAETVLVLASFESRAVARDDRVLNWLRRMAATSARIGGIETASEILAAAGLLDRRRVAVHWYNVEGFQERFPDVIAESARFRRDGRFLSSAGATATIDLMLSLIAEATSDSVASEVARHLMVDPSGPDRPLPVPPTGQRTDDPLVRRALALIDERLDESRNCAALARDLGVSLRQLQRRVEAARGRSLGREWQEAQFARAHQLVQQTDLSLTEIAIAVGYGSLEAFSRAYRKRFGISPSGDRGQTTETSVFRPPVLAPR